MSDFSEVNWGFSASQKVDELERRVRALERGLQILLRFFDVSHDPELLQLLQKLP